MGDSSWEPPKLRSRSSQKSDPVAQQYEQRADRIELAAVKWGMSLMGTGSLGALVIGGMTEAIFGIQFLIYAFLLVGIPSGLIVFFCGLLWSSHVHNKHARRINQLKRIRHMEKELGLDWWNP